VVGAQGYELLSACLRAESPPTMRSMVFFYSRSNKGSRACCSLLALVASSATSLLACGLESLSAKTPEAAPAPSQAPVAPVAVPAVVKPVIAEPAAAPVAVSIPEALLPPVRIACKFSGSPSGARPLPLRFDVSAEPFATTYKPATAVTVLAPVGSAAQGNFIEFEAGAALVRGYVQSADMLLYATAPSLFGGVLSPLGTAPLKSVSAEADSLTVTVPTEVAQVEFASGFAPEARPCSFFSLSPVAFDPLKATGQSAQRHTNLRPGRHELRAEQTGPVVATIVVGREGDFGMADVLAVSGSKRRIAHRLSNSLLVGWVDTATTHDVEGASGVDRLDPARAPRETGVASWKTAKCAEDLPLVAEVSGVKKTVGIVRAGKNFQLGPEQKGFRGVAFPQTDFMATDRAFLWIPAAKTASCTL
jgi:hypothetical protein